MALFSRSIVDAIKSHAMTLGVFDKVNGHEPKNAPANGLTCAIWAGPMETLPDRSGVNTVSASLILMVRIYCNMLKEPQDEIDLLMLDALDILIGAYCGDFDLGTSGNSRVIDLLGISGNKINAKPGYITIDQTMFRCYDIEVPVIINDAWSQTP